MEKYVPNMTEEIINLIEEMKTVAILKGPLHAYWDTITRVENPFDEKEYFEAIEQIKKILNKTKES